MDLLSDHCTGERRSTIDVQERIERPKITRGRLRRLSPTRDTSHAVRSETAHLLPDEVWWWTQMQPLHCQATMPLNLEVLKIKINQIKLIKWARTADVVDEELDVELYDVSQC